MNWMKATERRRQGDIRDACHPGRDPPDSLDETRLFGQPGQGKSDHIVLFFLF
jgi:hypothetical protein